MARSILVFTGVLALLSPTLAFAHPGDHMAMSAGQIAHHVLTSPDHLLELIMLGLMAAGGWIRLRRRAAR
jgi:hydrogenase/urease accessory protein HupE